LRSGRSRDPKKKKKRGGKRKISVSLLIVQERKKRVRHTSNEPVEEKERRERENIFTLTEWEKETGGGEKRSRAPKKNLLSTTRKTCIRSLKRGEKSIFEGRGGRSMGSKRDLRYFLFVGQFVSPDRGGRQREGATCGRKQHPTRWMSSSVTKGA